jgi:adenosylhomocysteinase
LKAGGAKVLACASNPLSTQDDVAASLVVDSDIAVYAIKGEDEERYYEHIRKAIAFGPHVTVDDGADLTSSVVMLLDGLWERLPKGLVSLRELFGPEGVSRFKARFLGGTEETTTGVIRLKAMAQANVLPFPVIAVNEAKTKHLFDNRYGTGQSTIDGILRATNELIAGKRFVVCGYGYCGKGVAMRARGMGAQVAITEVDPFRAIEASMDGFYVGSMEEAATFGDIFVTVTGNRDVIRKEHFLRMKDGAILANSGHFDVEIDLKTLRAMALEVKHLKPLIKGYRLENGKTVYVLAEGRLANLSCAEGHPAEVMDMSFAGQALAIETLKKEQGFYGPGVYPLPEILDATIARRKLDSLGSSVVTLTEAQQRYLADWQQGT